MEVTTMNNNVINDKIVQLKSLDQLTGNEVDNLFPITNYEAVQIDNDTNLKDKLIEIHEQIRQVSALLNNIQGYHDINRNMKPVNILYLGAKNDGSIDIGPIINKYTE